MAYKIKINPSARLDLIEAIDWYNNQQSNLGSRFYKNTQSTFKSIQTNPSGFAIRYKTIRTAIVKNFPYLVHYIIDQQTNSINILAIICMYRNPESWFEK